MIPFHFDMQPYLKRQQSILHTARKSHQANMWVASELNVPPPPLLPCGPEQCLCILSASESIKQETGADCGCLVSCWIKALSTHWEWQGHISSRSQHAVMWADEHSCLLHIRRTQLEPCDLQWDCSSFCTCRSLLFSFVRFGSIHDNRWWFSIQIPLVTNCQALFTEYSP